MKNGYKISKYYNLLFTSEKDIKYFFRGKNTKVGTCNKYVQKHETIQIKTPKSAMFKRNNPVNKKM